MKQINLAALKNLPPEQQAEAKKLMAELEARQRGFPLDKFRRDNPPQIEFLSAQTPVQLALAGNQFGKTTALVAKALIQVLPAPMLPSWMRPFKQSGDGPVFGRIVCPNFTEGVEGVIIPTFKEWTPTSALKGGSWAKAWNKQLRMIEFADGSWIQLMTYKQDPAEFVGPRLHFVGYDEPPPQDIRNECLMRLVRFNGFEMFSMTPLKVNTGWMRREIYKQRESPEVTVVRGSIHDNHTLNAEARERILNQYRPEERQAREFGEFMDFGGLIYPGFDQCVIPEPDPRTVKDLDHIISIDPGVRVAAILFGGVDNDNTVLVFDEVMLTDGIVSDYAEAIRTTCSKWGIRDPLYVIDPSARNRSLVDGRRVQAELATHGIYAKPGQNDIDSGIMQIRSRIRNNRLFVSRACLHTRDEADDYAAEDREDGVFKPNDGDDHFMDALKYLCAERPFDDSVEEFKPERRLGALPDRVGRVQLPKPAQDPYSLV